MIRTQVIELLRLGVGGSLFEFPLVHFDRTGMAHSRRLCPVLLRRRRERTGPDGLRGEACRCYQHDFTHHWDPRPWNDEEFRRMRDFLHQVRDRVTRPLTEDPDARTVLTVAEVLYRWGGDPRRTGLQGRRMLDTQVLYWHHGVIRDAEDLLAETALRVSREGRSRGAALVSTPGGRPEHLDPDREYYGFKQRLVEVFTGLRGLPVVISDEFAIHLAATPSEHYHVFRPTGDDALKIIETAEVLVADGGDTWPTLEDLVEAATALV